MFRKAFFLFIVFTLIACATNCTAGEKSEKKSTELSGKKILMVIAPANFKDDEYSKPRKVFEDKGATVTVASTSTSEAKGVGGTKVTPDKALKDVKAKEYDAIVFVGGPGAKKLFDDSEAHKVAKDAKKEGIVLAAICIAPAILAKAGVLDGKKATIWHAKADDGFVKMLKDGGATFTDKDVVTDGKIVTANGPKASEDFAKAIVKLLKKKKKEAK
ncbi:MAG: DJ-1/PfpI family protein [Planctomycetota bacterium]|nr:MAG: DJ-1/PfpI family protein [Planctomycetota bacterium]